MEISPQAYFECDKNDQIVSSLNSKLLTLLPVQSRDFETGELIEIGVDGCGFLILRYNKIFST